MTAYGNDRTHGGLGFGERNSGGVSILDFVVAYDLTIVNSHFKEDHLVSFRCLIIKNHIDYFLIKVNNMGDVSRLYSDTE